MFGSDEIVRSFIDDYFVFRVGFSRSISLLALPLLISDDILKLCSDQTSPQPDFAGTPLEEQVPSVINGRNWKRKIIGIDDFEIGKPSMSTR